MSQMPSAEPPSPGKAGSAPQDTPLRAARRTPWLLLGLLAAAVIVAVVAMLGWNSAITRADQQTSKAAAAQLAAAQTAELQQQMTALQRELASSKEREQALQGQAATAASELAQAQAKAAGSDAAEARAAAAEKAAAEAERSRVETQARVDALELAVGTADRRPPAGAATAAPTSSPPAVPLAAAAAGTSPALPLPGLPADATARDYLVAARQAIQAGNTAEAQASLERAETRLLNLASLAAGPNRPLRHPGVTEIEQVLDQLGANDGASALATIDRLLAQR
jgi:DNA repair exonuclease SbcCD ATPase subunit